MNKKMVFWLLATVVIVTGIYFYFTSSMGQVALSISSFTQCVEAGYPVMESYPRQCAPPSGPSFTEELPVEVKNLSVSAKEQIVSPLNLTGEARGTWFFEASLPVAIYDANGLRIALEPAQAQSDWMTPNFVPFSVTLTFAPPVTATGELVIMADNPSGDPQNDKEFRVPVTF